MIKGKLLFLLLVLHLGFITSIFSEDIKISRIVEHLDLKKQAILITSRYEEEEIRERVRNLGVKIIPKNFAPYISISIERRTVT